MKNRNIKNSLKVGLIVDSQNLHYIAWDLIERSFNSKEYSIEALIIQQFKGNFKTRFYKN